MIALTAREIARALGGHRAGAGWICRCITHDDRNPSLSIGQCDDGRVLVHCHAGCDAGDVIAELDRRGLWPGQGAGRERPARTIKSKQKPNDGWRTAGAQRLWYESIDPRGTWVEAEYLGSRGLSLPVDPEILLRTLRFHERCSFPDGSICPALICAFTPIWAEVPHDPFFDPPPAAIHRIRGRGHANKAMLGPVKGHAIMISPWWHVHETLHVCEGVETALALYGEGVGDPGCHRPIWALGSKEAIKALPIVPRVRRLIIWADNDANDGSVEAALACGTRWRDAGKTVVIRYPETQGEDFADWRSP